MTAGSICTVCKSGLGVRSGIEEAREGGQSIRSIAVDYARANLSESAIRRHLTQGHAQRSRMFTPADLDDAGLSPADAIGSIARGINVMTQIRDAAREVGNTATAIRAQGEIRAGGEALGKLGVIDPERLGASLANWEKFTPAIQAATVIDPDLTENYGKAITNAGHPVIGEQFMKFASIIRERNAAQAKKENHA